MNYTWNKTLLHRFMLFDHLGSSFRFRNNAYLLDQCSKNNAVTCLNPIMYASC